MDDPPPRWRLKLKVTLASDIRIIAVDRDSSYSKLVARIASDFNFDTDPVLKYQDADGDLILLTCQNDLNELVSSAKEANSTTVVVFVQPAAPAGRVAATLAAPTPAASAIQLVPLVAPMTMRGGNGCSSPLSDANPAPAISRQPSSGSLAGGAATFAEVPHPPSHARERPARHSMAPTRSGASAADTAGIAFRWRRGDQILGQGAFGTVFVGLNKDTGELLAVKQLDTGDVSIKELAALEHEIAMLKGLHHTNIVRYYGTERSSGTLSILLEYVPGGSIRKMIDLFGPLGEPIVRAYTRQLLLGLEYLHRAGIAHRDIKGGNVLITQDGCVKLADFGASKRLNNTTGSMAPSGTGTGTGLEGLKGTPLWMAPEVIREQHLHRGWKKADIWSVGCTVIEMATGRPPWSEFENPVTAMYHIACTDEIPPMPAQLSGLAHDFLKLCFRRDPLLRPNVTKLLLHPFVASTTTPLLHAQASSANARPTAFGGTVGAGSAGFYLPPRPATGAGGREHHRLLVPQHPTYYPIEEEGPEDRARATVLRRGGGEQARGGGGRGGVGAHVHPDSMSPVHAPPQRQLSLPNLATAAASAAAAAQQLAAVAPTLAAAAAWQLGANVLDTLQASPRALTADSAAGGARPSTSGSAFVKVRPTAAGGSGLGSPGRAASQSSSSPSHSPTEAGERLIPARIHSTAASFPEQHIGVPPDSARYEQMQWGFGSPALPPGPDALVASARLPRHPATPTFASPENMQSAPALPTQDHGAPVPVVGAATTPVASYPASVPPLDEYSPPESVDDYEEEAAAFTKSAELSTDALQGEHATILDHITSAALSLSATGRLQTLNARPEGLPPESDASTLPEGRPSGVSPVLSVADTQSQGSAAGTGGTRSNARLAMADTGAMPSVTFQHTSPTLVPSDFPGRSSAALISAPPLFVNPSFAPSADGVPVTLPLGALKVHRLAMVSRGVIDCDDVNGSAPDPSGLNDAAALQSARPGLPKLSMPGSISQTPVGLAALERHTARPGASPPRVMESPTLSIGSTPTRVPRASSPLSSVDGGDGGVQAAGVASANQAPFAVSFADSDAAFSARAQLPAAAEPMISYRRYGGSRKQLSRYSDLDAQPTDVSPKSHGTAPSRSDSSYAARHVSRAAQTQRAAPGGLPPGSPTQRRVLPTTAAASTAASSASRAADASTSASPGAGYTSDTSTAANLLLPPPLSIAGSSLDVGGSGNRPRLAEVPESYEQYAYEGAAVASPIRRSTAALGGAATANTTSATDESLQARFPSRIPRISTNYGRARSTATSGTLVAEPPAALGTSVPSVQPGGDSITGIKGAVRSDSVSRAQMQRNRGQYARAVPRYPASTPAAASWDAEASGSAARPGSRGMNPPTPPTAAHAQSIGVAGDHPHGGGLWPELPGPIASDEPTEAPPDVHPATAASTISLVRAKSGGHHRSKGRSLAASTSAATSTTGHALHPPRSAAPRRIARADGGRDDSDAGHESDTPGMSVAWTEASTASAQRLMMPPDQFRAPAPAAAAAAATSRAQPLHARSMRSRSKTTEETSWGPELPSVEPERWQILQSQFQVQLGVGVDTPPIAASLGRGVPQTQQGHGRSGAAAQSWESGAMHDSPAAVMVPVGSLAAAGMALAPGGAASSDAAAARAAQQQQSARRGVTAVVGNAPGAPRSSLAGAGSISTGGQGSAVTRSTRAVIGGGGSDSVPAPSGVVGGSGLPTFRSARDTAGTSAVLGSGGLGLVAVGQSSQQHSRLGTSSITTAAPAGSGSSSYGMSGQASSQYTSYGSMHAHHHQQLLLGFDDAAAPLRTSPVRILDQRLAAGGGANAAAAPASRINQPAASSSSAAGGGVSGALGGLVVAGGGLLHSSGGAGPGGVASFRQVIFGPSLSPIVPDRQPVATGVGAGPRVIMSGTPETDGNAGAGPSRADRAGSCDDPVDSLNGGGPQGFGMSGDGAGGDSESHDFTAALPTLTAANRASGGSGGADGVGAFGSGVPFPVLGGVQLVPAQHGFGAGLHTSQAADQAEPQPLLQPQPPLYQLAGFRGGPGSVASPRVILGVGGGVPAVASSAAAAALSGSSGPRSQLQLQQPSTGGVPAVRTRSTISGALSSGPLQQQQQLQWDVPVSGMASGRRPIFLTYGAATTASPMQSASTPPGTDWEGE